MIRMKGLLCLLLGLLLAACGVLAGCSGAPDHPAPSPAIWEISRTDGRHGYLFGTVHALPDGTKWRTPLLDKAFAASDMLVVEIASLTSPREMAAVFARLASSPGQPPLADRVSPEKRAIAIRVMADKGLRDADYTGMETWAVALALSQLSDDGESRNGVDRALLKAAGKRRIIELEGVEAQLGLFDRLPASEQSDLLEQVIIELDRDQDKGQDRGEDSVVARQRLHAWLTGNVAGLEQEMNSGLLTDPELRTVLLVNRNIDWAGRIDALLAGGGVPFVAVGAAHLLGTDGLVSLLETRGYTVTRIQ